MFLVGSFFCHFGLHIFLLLLEVLELDQQFLVFGFEAIQEKLVGVEVGVIFHGGLFELVDDAGGVLVVVGVEVLVELGDVLLNLRYSGVEFGRHPSFLL